MPAQIIDGKEIAERVREEVAQQTEAFVRRTGINPGLAAILVGDDPASKVYVGHKKKACAKAGLHAPDLDLPGDIPEEDLIAKIEALNADDSVHGILIQLPLPKHINAARVQKAVDPRKDVDCFHPENVGMFYMGDARFIPCTPRGCMELIDRIGYNLKGKRAVVVGRSNIVGKPMSFLLMSRHATVTMCHSRTVDLPGVCREADVLVTAIGREKLVTADFVKPGAVVIDVGINAVEENGKRRLFGDVDFESVMQTASYVTPVPGGVGPMTIAMLLKNTIDAAEAIVK